MVKINNWFSLENTENVLTITFEKSATTIDFDQYLEQYRNLYINNKEIIVIFDARKISNVPPSQIIKKVALMQMMKPIHKKYLKHFYIVASSKYTLNIVKNMFNIIKPVAPYNIYKTMEEIPILNFSATIPQEIHP
jgi:hypothetical protein